MPRIRRASDATIASGTRCLKLTPPPQTPVLKRRQKRPVTAAEIQRYKQLQRAYSRWKQRVQQSAARGATRAAVGSRPIRARVYARRCGE
jgi:predicted deacetylase